MTTESKTTDANTTEGESTTTDANTTEGESSTTDANTTEGESTTERKSKSLTVGETATLEGGLEGTVQRFRFTSEYESGGTTKSTDQTFLFVQFTVENPTDKRKKIPSGLSIYVTINGKRYDPTDYRGGVRRLYTSKSIDAGAARSGALIFEVPMETTRSDVTAVLKYAGSDGTVTDRWNAT